MENCLLCTAKHIFNYFKMAEMIENNKHFDGGLPVVRFSFLLNFFRLQQINADFSAFVVLSRFHWLTAKMVEEIS
ncbi:Homoserine O-acetyltransferase [Trichinella pseudospiralis]